MPSMSKPSAGDAGPDPGCPDIAATATATWQAIDSALRPILGGRGVQALYWRSLHLAAADHPWLIRRIETVEEAMDLEALAAAIAGQDAEHGQAGSRAVQLEFLKLLTSLVGASLSARLLASVPAMSADTPNPQDTPR
jgi:hypothetical protein